MVRVKGANVSSHLRDPRLDERARSDAAANLVIVARVRLICELEGENVGVFEVFAPVDGVLAGQDCVDVVLVRLRRQAFAGQGFEPRRGFLSLSQHIEGAF